jgi:hypothetical protein
VLHSQRQDFDRSLEPETERALRMQLLKREREPPLKR